MELNTVLRYAILFSILLPGVYGKAQNYPSRGNYDESKTGSYVLPDPLTMENGKKVNKPGQWRNTRRKEILELFRKEMYGAMPPSLKIYRVEDYWCDPRGEFLSCVGADPVCKLLGTDGLPGFEFPEAGEAMAAQTGYHLRPGGHDFTRYDWKQYLDFADCFLKNRMNKCTEKTPFASLDKVQEVIRTDNLNQNNFPCWKKNKF